jgi:ketosteroid isomerase-like protein
MSSNEEIVLRVFRAIEERDAEALFDLYHEDVELHEAPSLPYGYEGVSGKEAMREQLESTPERSWLGTWGPLQPTEVERRMDPRVVATRGDEVVIAYTTRAVSPSGERFELPVLGLYEVHDGKFARARMFHFDTAAILAFLERAGRREAVEAA